MTKSDLLIVNKIDLAPHVGVDAGLLAADTRRARGPRPFVMASLRTGEGVDAVADFIVAAGGL